MEENKKKDSALHVKKGVEQPGSVDSSAIAKFIRNKKADPTVEEFVQGIRDGNITLLSKAITLIESSLPDHHTKAQKIIEKCLPFTGDSLRIGITGVPGVGKSTFIEALGSMLTQADKKVAVLAIDPSSNRTKGSILGDKTRMESLSIDAKAFIRPSPSAGTLGGVARKTHETIILCEAAGFDTIMVETVGVGQSEVAVHSMIDFFLLLQLAGAGDELQGIKRGIMEMADAIIINKAEGDNLHKAELAKREYANALHLFPAAESGWTPVVDMCSAYTGFRIPEVWGIVEDYFQLTQKNGYFLKKRSDQAKQIMHQTIQTSLNDLFYYNSEIKPLINQLEHSVQSDKISSYNAAAILIDKFIKNLHNPSSQE